MTFLAGPRSVDSLPPSLKKGPDLSGAFVRKNAFYDLDPVVVPGIIENLEQGADRARLWIPCAEDEGLDPGMQARARTHQAGLQGDEELGTHEPVIA
jgi:hypothetical protein